jgi:hypothetical protein
LDDKTHGLFFGAGCSENNFGSSGFHVGNMANAVSTTRPFQTTKLTKGTKDSENHDSKLRVLRAFVVETLFNILPTGNPENPQFLTNREGAWRQS